LHGQMLSDVLEQLEYSRHFSLCEQIDLKVQMAPLSAWRAKRFWLASTNNARKMASNARAAFIPKSPRRPQPCPNQSTAQWPPTLSRARLCWRF